MKKLSIAILSSNRFDLLSATINSLLATLRYPNWEMIIYNRDKGIGEGWNYLTESVSGEYVLMCQDDWFFMERWNWVEQAMAIVDNKEFGIVRLRKNDDGQRNEERIKFWTYDKEGLKFAFKEIRCKASGFNLNPFVCSREFLKRIGKVSKTGKEKGAAEIQLREKYNARKYKTAKLGNEENGVCIHIGRGRRIIK